MKFIVIIISCLLINLKLYSQDWIKIHEDNQITLEVNIKVSKNICEDGGGLTKYKYRIKGQLYNDEKYITWKIDYIDCKGQYLTEGNSIIIGGDLALKYWAVENYYLTDEIVDKNIDNTLQDCATLRSKPYEINISYSELNSREPTKSLLSENPKEIIASDTIFYGEAVDLYFENGILGTNAEWTWYTGNCGANPIGKGDQITVDPKENTTYFLRAEGPNNTTNCIRKTIYVDKKSYPANTISGNIDVCKDELNEYEVEGGILGKNAQWVWYENGCNGKKLGYGQKIAIKVSNNIRIFVRAEGEINNTECVSIDVKILAKPNQPNSIVISNNMICQNTLISASVNDKNSPNIKYCWYVDNVNSLIFKEGKNITFTITDKIILFVKAVNKCDASSHASIVLKPLLSSTEVQEIKILRRNRTIAISEIKKYKKYEFVPIGGKLGANAKWSWYKNDVFLGNNEKIKLKIDGTTTISINAEGTCNKTKPFNLTIYPKDSEKWRKTFENDEKTRNKHLGFAIGADFSANEINGKETVIDSNFNIYNNEVKALNSGYGLKFEVSYHPIMEEFFSIGFSPSITFMPKNFITNFKIPKEISVSNVNLTSYDSSLVNSNPLARSLNYKFETEICLGYGWFKLIGRSIFSLNDARFSTYYENPINKEVSTSNFNQVYFNEYICLGLRLGKYEKKKLNRNNKQKKGSGLDLMVTYRRNEDSKYNYNNIFDVWDSGIGLTWWIQNAFKLQLLADSKTANIAIFYTFDRFK